MTAVQEDLDLLEGDLGDRIRTLGLEQNAADLALVGYTVVRDVAPLEFIDEIRARILELVDEQRAAGNEPKEGGPFEESAWMLLKRGRIFEQAACNPKLVALNELMLGKGWRAGVVGGTVKRGGTPPMPLHTDHIATGIREPYPQQCEILTSLWTLDDWTEEGGATRLVPRSNRLRRAPRGGLGGNSAGSVPEGDDQAIPVECPKGSLILWDGATWHGNCARTITGDRVSFHTPAQHLARQTLEDYSDLPDEIVERNPPVFARMIGRGAPWGKQTFTSPPGLEIGQMWLWNNSDPTYP